MVRIEDDINPAPEGELDVPLGEFEQALSSVS
jgi:hypothetical protein